jgi:hypothetical protein
MNPVPAKTTRAREARAWELKSRGYTDARIAAELGVSRSTVTKALGRVERRELGRLSDQFEAQKVLVLARLEAILRAAWEGWDLSKRPERTVRVRHGPRGRTAERVWRSRCGDPRCLNLVRRVLRDIRELLGLDAPRQVILREPAPTPRFVTVVARPATPAPAPAPEGDHRAGSISGVARVTGRRRSGREFVRRGARNRCYR